VLGQISEGIADHETFAKRYKDETELLKEIFRFGCLLIGYDSNDTLSELFNKLTDVSTELNLQFNYYYSNHTLFEVKENKYIFPLVLNFLLIVDNVQFYTLYQRNFKVISHENSNTSEKFKYELEYKNRNYHLEKLASDIVDIFAEARPVLQANEKDAVIQSLELLRSVSSKGAEFIDKLAPILK
jgi:hypothetical protein